MSRIRFIAGKRARTCATSPYASQLGQTIYDGNIVCNDSGNLIVNKQINGNSDVIQTRSQVERARNSILYATSGRIQFGNFVSLEQLREFLNANATNPDIYSPYSILNPNSPEYQYYNVYSTQPNRIPGIRNRF